MKAIVYGAGKSGLGAKKLLEKQGYEVILVDDKNGISSQKAIKYLDEIDIFIKSPGIPYNDFVKLAIDKNINLIDEIELAYMYMNKNTKIIAITGTNGKTTVTSKIKELLEYNSYKVKYAGNIGISFSEIVLEGKDLDYIVLELSSYQLENIKTFKPYISMIINLTPDHMNRYSSLDEYYNAKFNIYKNCNNTDYFILNIDDNEIMTRFNKNINLKKISLENEADIYYKNNYIFINKEMYINKNNLSLKGIHNIQNILFIISVSEILGLDRKKLKVFLETTNTLEHRMEEFFKKEDTLFINDSKGTNIDSTIKAIEAFEKDLILITGGKDKKVDLYPLCKIIKNKVKKVYLIGETADILEEILLELEYKKENIKNLKTIEKVVDNLKLESEIVLFSPAHSSFDQFKNFEERGKIFKELILQKFN
ncbi:UDP-N-acetylmuramoylalanine--D-glutamate ligase [Hypnocyclicus thermotrophus]|uniref:UDP-N-acetylmuramoylalanine--D-glutamate ligase n=1 Tax=Hypnocyclicus thermotrophus TaxID=1627895 RepID=A0AA46I5K3_9FUSO|nr:UDP-N-acetylmuramoylalanine--D-glutamate ligase [Hypnocyclicus thermotrophus]